MTFRSRSNCRQFVWPLSLLAALTAPLAMAFQHVDEPPPVVPSSLKTIPVPLPDDLADYVVDMAAAERLGYLLFWDMQLGSDGVMACASCHYHAGADNRFVNQIAPGPGGQFHETFTGAGGPNYTLNAGDFPFHRLLVPDDNASEVVHSIPDRVSSQGVFRSNFVSVNPGNGVDNTTIVDDEVFNVAEINTRRVEPRNAPTVINSIFIHRLFHDGRANHFFNGRNPFGDTDPDAKILIKNSVTNVVEPVRVLLNNAATASQAVGPIVSDFEMSGAGRDRDNIGKKMVPVNPLATQLVHPEDSRVGGMSASPANGLLPNTLTYGDLIQQAFHTKLWDQDGDGDYTNDPASFGGFTQMEKNFSFFFGVAILVYESTLVSDDSPFDQYQDGGGEGGSASDALTLQQKEGLDIFMNRAACIACHAGSEFAGAAISQLVPPEGLLERMLMEDGVASASIDLVTPVNPAQVDPEEPPEPPHPTDVPLLVDPRAKLVEIRQPNGAGPPLAIGFANFSTNVGIFDPPIDERIVLPTGSGVPDPLGINFTAELRFRNDTAGNMRFTIGMEWQHPGLPGGDYTVFVAGGFVGTLKMRQVRGPAVYDNGFYNIGVRPTNEDPGNGGVGPFGPFALAARARLGQDVDGGVLQPPVGVNERIAVHGAFRTPTLRNVELTGPYMHNGGFSTLEQVVDFYTGGAHFFDANIDDLDPEVGGIGGMSSERKAALVAFLKALTDERVRYEKAPFDHPELRIPNGHPGDTDSVTDRGDGAATDDFKVIPAVGANGGPAIEPFHVQLAANVSALPSAGLTVTEGGTPATAHISLDRAPAANVTVGLSVSDTTEATISTQSLVFTPQNWSTPQKVTITPVQDNVVDGDVQLKLVTAAAQSNDPDFAGTVVDDVPITTKDSGLAYTYKYIEAESGTITAPMVVKNAAAIASGGKYIITPNGTGNVTSSGGTGGLATYNFSVPRTGLYTVWVREYAANANDDTCWVRMDNGQYTVWTMQRPATPMLLWDAVNNSAGQDPIRYNLTAGAHTLRIKHREDGAAIDRIVITDDPAFVPPTGP